MSIYPNRNFGYFPSQPTLQFPQTGLLNPITPGNNIPTTNPGTRASFDTAPVSNNPQQAVLMVLKMLIMMLSAKKSRPETDTPKFNLAKTNQEDESLAQSPPAGDAKKPSVTKKSSKNINWGTPSNVSEDPNGAYQVPGGFQPPKGNEKAEAKPGVTANPGNIQNANAAPDDSKSHSRIDKTQQWHSMEQVEQMYGDIVDEKLAKYNAKYGVDCPREVILGIIYQESGGDPNTLGKDDPAQSRGLMQVTADNAAREFPGKNQYNPDVSIETGVEAYTRTLKQHNGNHMQALAAYNQGKPTTSQGKAYAQWIKLWAEQVP